MAFRTSIMLVVSVLVPFVASESTAVVNTTSGPVQGKISMSVNGVPFASFVGMRYGKPPIGDLRYRAPIPVDPWNETLNATVEGNVCPQKASNNSVVGSEDCLFLNVFTPETNLSMTPTNLKAVMVWIYGGAFKTGSSKTNEERPDFLLERDVVFVSMNYRLGALGFLSMNLPNITGNQGLKDQLLALKWVQSNIEKFGGNPNNVTIFGESAGAVSVGLHTVSDASVGLFHGAISMSGTPFVPWGFGGRDNAVGRARTLAELLGGDMFSDDSVLETLYSASVEDIIDRENYVDPVIPFKPTLENSSIAVEPFLTECSIDKYNAGNFSQVPQLLGFMQQETVAFIQSSSLFIGIIDEIVNTSEDLADDVLNILNVLKTLVEGADYLLNAGSYHLLETGINITTDLFFKAEIDETQKVLVKHLGDIPVYYYDITFFTNRSRHNLEATYTIDGAGHADDLAYIFYIPANNYNLSLSNPMGLTIYRVSTMWTNFAKYGNPTPDWVDEYPLGITWPASGDSGTALNIGSELTVVDRPTSIATKLYQEVWAPLLPVWTDCHNNS